eukprot:TRINITY_DN3466_c0_g1_i1.p1 TRINITY_DN3466_c0_g1~~TRINITY_DN3466_c0_g1_i1.p1  ORF type:complete len:327 (+),score=120.73 TRINITY_DN3466_c0_g1_i1:295-1275(+)
MEKWNWDPFAAEKDENGNIYARGTQDMKSVGIQYIEAVHRLKQSGKTFPRTIHLSYIPDEEVGGRDGAEIWVDTQRFRDLNVGLVLDEGLASPDETFTVFYGERIPWWVRIKVDGPAGHGSRFIENTAPEKLMRVINSMLKFRTSEFERLQKGQCECGMKLGDVTTLNLTAVRTGVTSDGGKTYAVNVIPTEAEACFDIRIPPTVDLEKFKKQLEDWCTEAGEGITYEFIQHLMQNKATSIQDDHAWWRIFRDALTEQGCKLETEIFPAATDSRFIRNKGYPAFGFSPMNFTPTLLHDHNEFLNDKIFLRGIEIYMGLIPKLASAP